jgi:hypothetical protein
MVDLGILITGGVGMVTTFMSGWVSWFFARRKYNSEVDSNEIENLKKSLEFYEDIVRDNNKKLQFYIDLAENNRIEVYRLKGVIQRLLNNSCLDNGCIKRKFYTEEQIKDILEGAIPLSKEDKDEIET